MALLVYLTSITDSERHHIQAFISTIGRKRYNQITERLGIEPFQVHYEQVVRTPEKAWDYCSEKKGVRNSREDSDGESSEEESTRHGCPAISFGERPRGRTNRGAGRRGVDWQQLRDLAAGGLSDRQLLESNEHVGLVLGHWNAYRWAKSVLRAPLNTATEWSERGVIVFWGPAGCGKSKRVRAECEELGIPLWVAPVGATGAWYDGYDNHAAALFDDFVGGMSFRDLLNILEGNKVLVQVKGSSVTWCPKLVYFTSDRHWTQWLFPKGPDRGLGPLSPEEESQLGRRITLCEEMQGSPVPLAQALGMNPSCCGGGYNTGAPSASPPPQDAPDPLFFTEEEWADILRSL